MICKLAICTNLVWHAITVSRVNSWPPVSASKNSVPGDWILGRNRPADARDRLLRMFASSSVRTYCGFNPSASNCQLHSAGASRSRSTPMPRGKRLSTAASEMVILACRTLHFWRVAIYSMLVAEPETISSSHLRPRAIALTRRARRSMRVGRTSFRRTPSGMRICRDFLDGDFCQGIDSNSLSDQAVRLSVCVKAPVAQSHFRSFR